MRQLVALAILIVFPSNDCAEGQVLQENFSPDKVNNPSSVSHMPADTCRIGQLPKNGWVEFVNPPYRKLTSEDYVNISTSVKYKCGEQSVQVTTCGNDGVWTPPPEECSVTCGIVTNNVKNPWIVKIARYVAGFLVYDFGSIINSRMILTVADQFWNRTEQKTNDLSQYWVQIEIGTNILQKIELERIAYAPNYDKFINAPSGNIVIVVLRTSIEFKSNIMPVCLPFELYSDDAIPSSFEGQTPEQDNVVLQLPTICYSEWESSPPSAAMDVLCTNRMKTVGKYIGTGSSFTVPIEKNGSKAYYLLGIRTWWHSYNGVKYYQFQNILFYKDFIQTEISYENENKKHSKTANTMVSSSVIDSTIPSTTVSSPLVDKNVYCRLDNIPNKGNAYYESNPDQKIEYGEKIQNLISIVYRCIENHVLYGNSSNYCVDGKWIFAEPECKPRCNPMEIQGWTLVANCRFQEDSILRQTSCTEPAAPGTIASINCQRGYQRFGSYHQKATCGSDGRWSPLPEKCFPVCGEISQGGAYIVGGQLSEISNVPWHAGIYRKYRQKHGLEQICGGSIITAKVVVSAMHCFWDSSKDKIHNKEEFEVAVGKSRRILDELENFKPQFFKVENIFYEDGYNDYAGNYANDIAIVILSNYIEFKSYIAPVCIHLDLQYDDKIVQPGLTGKVAGWGLEQSSGQPSATLKEIELPVISRKDCIEKSTDEFRKFITSDKFCAGHLTGISVCQGDSGGGLVFPQTEGIKTVYFLRGIVSTGANKQGSCDNDKYTTFTNLAYYTDLINKYYLEYQPNL